MQPLGAGDVGPRHALLVEPDGFLGGGAHWGASAARWMGPPPRVRAAPRARLHGPQTTSTSLRRIARPSACRCQAWGLWSACRSSVDPQSLQNGCSRRARLLRARQWWSYPLSWAVGLGSACRVQRGPSLGSPQMRQGRRVMTPPAAGSSGPSRGRHSHTVCAPCPCSWPRLGRPDMPRARGSRAPWQSRRSSGLFVPRSAA